VHVATDGSSDLPSPALPELAQVALPSHLADNPNTEKGASR
jgi:hypothetical protein